MRAFIFAAALLSNVALAQTALAPIGPDDYVGQVVSTFVKRSGDTMGGPLRISSQATYLLNLGAPGSTAARGICFNPAAGGTCTSTAGLTFAPSTNYLTMSAPTFVGAGGSQMLWSGQISNDVNTHPALLLSAQGLRITGKATASLPACNSGNKGSFHFDTTTNKIQFCQNGSAWEQLGGASTLGADAWHAYAPASTAADGAFDATTAMLGAYYSQSDVLGAVRNVTCQYGTAGANGGGANAVKVGVYDVTAAADYCTCTLSGDCTADRTTPVRCDCGGSVMTAAHSYVVYLHGDTDCGTNPGLIACNVMVEH